MGIVYTDVDSVRIESRIGENHYNMDFQQIHSFYEMYYLAGGHRKYFIEDTIYKVEEGDVVFIPPNVLHRSLGVGVGRYSRILVDIPATVFENEILSDFEVAFNGYIFNIPPKHRKFFEQILGKMEDEYEQKDVYSKYLINNSVNEMLVFLIHINKGAGLQPSGIESDRLISRAAQYIRQNFELPLTLEDVAEEINMSRTYFSKLFKRKTGVGFSDYLTVARITEAAHLLAETDMDITEVATQCGYSDS